MSLAKEVIPNNQEVVSAQSETVYPVKKSEPLQEIPPQQAQPEQVEKPLVKEMEKRLIKALKQVPPTITNHTERIIAAQRIVMDQLQKEKAEQQRPSLEPPFASGALSRDERRRFLEEHTKRSSQLARQHTPTPPR